MNLSDKLSAADVRVAQHQSSITFVLFLVLAAAVFTHSTTILLAVLGVSLGYGLACSKPEQLWKQVVIVLGVALIVGLVPLLDMSKEWRVTNAPWMATAHEHQEVASKRRMEALFQRVLESYRPTLRPAAEDAPKK